MGVCVCMCVKAVGGSRCGAPVQGAHAASLSACSSPSPWRREQLLHSWALAWLAAAPPRLSVRPTRLLQPWSCQLPSPPPAAHRPCQGRAQESVLTNNIHTAPWARGLCPEMSGRGHRGGAWSQTCLGSRGKTLPGPLLPWPFSAQARLPASWQSQAGTQTGPSKALSEVSPAYSAYPETPDHSWLGCPFSPVLIGSSPRLLLLEVLLLSSLTEPLITRSSQGHQELKELRCPVQWSQCPDGENRGRVEWVEAVEGLWKLQSKLTTRQCLWHHALLFDSS